MKGLPLRIAVVGHTNTGKTSLLRTLTRDVTFGDVSDRPATTRHVEGTALLVDGEPIIELFDTPGLEDSTGLFEHLDALRTDPRSDHAHVIERFLASDEAQGRFAQEAKALRQAMKCDVALYVIDAREHVLGRHRDELTILSWCGKPVIPMLNFIATSSAHAPHWREQLARIGLHVVAEFDTVVVDDQSEQRLIEKLRTVAEQRRPALDAYLVQRQRERSQLIAASARTVADMLIDVAAFAVHAPIEEPAAAQAAIELLKRQVRERERRCAEDLLLLHRFRKEDYDSESSAVVDTMLGMDVFSPEAMKQFGLMASRGAAVGAVAGVAIDAMTGGLTLGAAAATGAAIGAAFETARKHGGRLLRKLRKQTEVRCDPHTVRLLALRQIALVRTLLSRGHASQSPARPGAHLISKIRASAANPLPSVLQRAVVKPHWSAIGESGRFRAIADPSRAAAVSELAELIEHRLRAADDSLMFP